MNAITDTQGNFLDLSKLNAQEIEMLRDFYSFLIFKKKTNQEHEKNDIKKLPDAFYQPTKVNNYLAFERDEIYGKE